MELKDCFDLLFEQVRLRVDKAAKELEYQKALLKIVEAERDVIMKVKKNDR